MAVDPAKAVIAPYRGFTVQCSLWSEMRYSYNVPLLETPGIHPGEEREAAAAATSSHTTRTPYGGAFLNGMLKPPR